MIDLLPHIDSVDDYVALLRDEALWPRVLRAICQRHGLSPEGAARARSGSNIVYAVEGGHFLKLVAPVWRDTVTREFTSLAFVEGRLGLTTPRVEASGELDGWPYLILSALPGVPVRDVWDEIAPTDRLGVVESLGESLAALHALPTADLSAIDLDWDAFLAHRLERCAVDQERRGMPRHFVDQLPRYLEARVPLLEAPYRKVLLHADVTASHVLLEERGGRWQLSGLFDFGDARLGGHEYEFAALSGRVLGGRGALQRAFLLAYGYGESDLDAELAARICLHVVLHEFVGVARLLELFAEDAPRDLEELECRLWPMNGAPRV